MVQSPPKWYDRISLNFSKAKTWEFLFVLVLPSPKLLGEVA